VIAGTDRSIEIMDLAAQLKRGFELPGDVLDTLDAQAVMESTPSAFPNGRHIAEVEIDTETGLVAVVKYTMVNDFGVIVNPLLVEGQAHGGVVQGIGQALMERVVFDENGQLLTGSFTDYALPPATDVVEFRIASHPAPAKTQPAGCEGLRRGRLRRFLTGGDERGRRRAARVQHPPHRYAGHAAQGVAGNSGR
jgi:carbon-monoxide dehydrogenase large subunit